jgi:type VI secretion system secreted protein Hcp
MPVYLKLGALQGAVTTGPYKGWIEVESFQWGFNVDVQTTVGASGDRMASGKVTPGDVHLVKVMDDTTTTFMLQALQGKNTDQGTIAVTLMASQDGSDRYIEYVMDNVICSSFNTAGTQSGGKPMENISLNFTKVEFNQFLKDAAGNERVVRGGFDFTKATKV